LRAKGSSKLTHYRGKRLGHGRRPKIRLKTLEAIKPLRKLGKKLKYFRQNFFFGEDRFRRKREKYVPVKLS